MLTYPLYYHEAVLHTELQNLNLKDIAAGQVVCCNLVKFLCRINDQTSLCVCTPRSAPPQTCSFPGLKWMGVCLLLSVWSTGWNQPPRVSWASCLPVLCQTYHVSPLPLCPFLPINISRSIFSPISPPLWALSLPPPPCPLCSDPEPHCHTNNSLGTLTLLVSVM